MVNDFAAIDFELANGVRTSVCSMGVVVVRGGEVVERFYSLVKPVPNFYHWGCSKVNKLNRRSTDSAETFPKVWSRIAPRIEGLTLVAHNAVFDGGTLRAVMKAYNMKWPGYEFQCTCKASQRLLPELPDHRLPTVSAACGFVLERHHHALADAEACAAIALKLL